MKADERSPGRNPLWMLVAGATPLFVLLLASAAGLSVPIWLYALVVVWTLVMPFLMGGQGAHKLHGGARDDDLEAESSEAKRRTASTLASAIPDAIMDLRGWEVTPGGVVLRGPLRVAPESVQAQVSALAQKILGRTPHVMVHEDPNGQPYVLVLSAEVERSLAAAVPRRRPWINLALFAATLITTTFAGAVHQGIDVLRQPAAWTSGLPYALGIMLILGVHEMGHYLTAHRRGIQVSLPYFIPVPFALGTFGAFIKMPPLLSDRRQLFDIGVAGPLAGLAVAIPALMIGLQWSEALPADVTSAGHMFHGVSVNSSILLAIVSKLAIPGALAEGHYLVLHPLAFAGWLGLMLTALNLIPVGQLDGGHVAHALFGRRHAEWIGRVALFAMVVLGLFVWSGLLLWALLIFFIAGRRGIPPMDDITPLDGRRRAVGGLAFALLVLILTPVPHALSPALGLHCPYL